MTLMDAFRVAIVALRLNMLRSVLTTLGIVIGVASVIVMVAVGSGARQAVQERIKSLGSNLLTISPGARFGARRGAAGTALPFSERDLAAIRDEILGVVAISGQLSTSGTVVAGSTNWSTSISGTHADYARVRDWTMREGRFFTNRENAQGARVVVLGGTAAQELFGNGPALGAIVRVQNVPMEVIGVLQELGQSGWGRDRDDLVIIPMSVMRARIAGRGGVVPDQVGQILVKIAEGNNIALAEEAITELLRKRRRGQSGGEDDFRVRNLADLIRARTETQTTLTWLLAATAAISLIVGGIGIMNIMLVSVTERTREIGLRMALGARRQDILTQFLVEATTLCLLGGAIGLVIGITVSQILAGVAGWSVVIGPATVAVAIGASGGVGLLFGYFPARSAARLRPIDALRYE